MKIVTSPSEMRNLSITFQRSGKTVGLVPTMGALHAGHQFLISSAARQCDVVVTSVFVNPAQFGPSEDFSKYPRPFERDCLRAERSGSSIVFAPEANDMYHPDHATSVVVKNITERLCGASRPGHFTGVATVVLKLFNIVIPKLAVFGQKDAQQCLVIRRMVRDLNCPVALLFAPTVREEDGLAMSSRNAYLSPEERRDAALIYKSLTAAAALYESGEHDASRLRKVMGTVQRASSLFTVEYAEIVDMVSVLPATMTDGPCLAAVAVRTNQTNTRLIDNIVLGGTF